MPEGVNMKFCQFCFLVGYFTLTLTLKNVLNVMREIYFSILITDGY